MRSWQPLARIACFQKLAVIPAISSLHLQAGRDKAKPHSATFLGLQIVCRGNIGCSLNLPHAC